MPAEPLIAERVLATIRPEADDSLLDWIKDSRITQSDALTTDLPDDAELKIPWATRRMPWQPEVVNDEKFDGLFDYQRSAVDRLARVRRAILADDMGLGKTLDAISTVEEFRLRNLREDGFLPDGPKVVVCPSSVMGSWGREFDRWLEEPNYRLIDGASANSRHNQLVSAITDDAWSVVNWEQLRVKREKVKFNRRSGSVGKKTVTYMKEPLFQYPWLASEGLALADWGWQEAERTARKSGSFTWLAVLADEIHRAKNRKALQTQGLFRTRADDGIMLGMSGTPLMNSPDELWSILHWLYPDEYTSYWRFYENYVDYYENPYFGGKIITGVKNPDALRFELKDRLIRRTAGSVRSLPGRRRIYYPITLNKEQRGLYDDAETAIWLKVEQEIKDGDRDAKRFAQAVAEGKPITEVLQIKGGATRTLRLRQILETPATLGAKDDSAILDDLEEKIMDSRPEQWTVYCEFVETAHCVARRLKDKDLEVRVYTGEDASPKERTRIEDEFQRGEVDVIVGTMKALREGITLTRGHHQYWISRDWVPAYNEQGEARGADRVGQQNKTIIYIPQGLNTVADNNVLTKNELKDRIVRSVLPKDNYEEVKK